MSRHRHNPAAKRAAAKPENTWRALAAALARLVGSAPAPGSEPGGPPQPGSAWERSAEQRLNIIEKQLSNQNRLLLLTLVSIVADVLIGAAK